MLFGGGPVSGQSSSSRRENVLMTGHFKFVQGSPSPDRGLEGKEHDCSWWEWQEGVGCFGEWVKGLGRGPSE